MYFLRNRTSPVFWFSKKTLGLVSVLKKILTIQFNTPKTPKLSTCTVPAIINSKWYRLLAFL